MKFKLFILIGFLVVIAIVGLAVTKSNKPTPAPNTDGAVPRDQVADCSAPDEVCVMENGKMVVKKIPKSALQGVQHYCTGSDCPTPAPPNYQAAIAAIRLYTQNPNLKLTPVSSKSTTLVTWYCTEDNQCWAVNNASNQVLNKQK